MAIVIEQNRKRFNWFALAVIVALVAIIGIAVYYLFFSPVPLIGSVLPPGVSSIEKISSSKFDPTSISQNSLFQVLRQYVNPVQVPSPLPQKANPFSPR